MRAITDWTDRPDLASVNFTEEGWEELVPLLAQRDRRRGRHLDGARRGDARPGRSRVGPRLRGTRHHPPVHRILVEPRSQDADEAIQAAAEIDAVLDAAATPHAAPAPRAKARSRGPSWTPPVPRGREHPRRLRGRVDAARRTARARQRGARRRGGPALQLRRRRRRARGRGGSGHAGRRARPSSRPGGARPARPPKRREPRRQGACGVEGPTPGGGVREHVQLNGGSGHGVH